MEHFKVTFDPLDIRDVLLDTTRIGQTETILMTPANFYRITLSGPADYAPLFQDVLIDGTTPQTPKVIVFTKVAASV
jgi:hypothetical protein